ncbi:MAG: thioredoxin [Bacteroidia bacterium]
MSQPKTSFASLIQSSQPVLVDFYADWCGPCHAMAPVLRELAAEMKEKANIIKVDVDKNPQVAQAYQIMGIPTFILFQEGQVKWRGSGVMPKTQLKNVIEQFA